MEFGLHIPGKIHESAMGVSQKGGQKVRQRAYGFVQDSICMSLFCLGLWSEESPFGKCRELSALIVLRDDRDNRKYILTSGTQDAYNNF
jgi:hypothetical protein